MLLTLNAVNSEKSLARVFTATILLLLVSGCTAQENISDKANESERSLEKIHSRSPDSPILGKVSADGQCDPQIVSMDKGKNTPHILYKGQPGDVLTIKYISSKEMLKEDSFELSGTTTSVQTGASIYNGDLERIQINAHGTVGTTGECHIIVG